MQLKIYVIQIYITWLVFTYSFTYSGLNMSRWIQRPCLKPSGPRRAVHIKIYHSDCKYIFTYALCWVYWSTDTGVSLTITVNISGCSRSAVEWTSYNSKYNVSQMKKKSVYVFFNVLKCMYVYFIKILYLLIMYLYISKRVNAGCDQWH